jgi:serine/threonine-protein kinase
VGVFDFGTTHLGDPFLVMELVEGESLSRTLERAGRLSAVDAVRLLIPVIDGLRTAHGMRVIHRDVKPANVHIVTDKRGARLPKLLDFGIAKLSETYRTGITAEGTVLGSPEYMSPEQALGCAELDARTDVWSVCATLYHLIAGTPPYLRSTYNALIQAILHDPVTPTTERGLTDAALWAILKRGLEKDPARRIASMAELGSALSQWLLAQGVLLDSTRKALSPQWEDVPETPKPNQYSSPSIVWATNLQHDSSASVSASNRARRVTMLTPAIWLASALLAGAGITVLWSEHPIGVAAQPATPRPSIGVTSALNPSNGSTPDSVAPAACAQAHPTAPPPSVDATSSPRPRRTLRSEHAQRSRYHDFGF